MGILDRVGSGAGAGAAFGPWGAAIGGGIGLLGGLFGASAQSDAQKRQQSLENEALGYARDNYAGRSGFRTAANSALNDPGQNFNSYYDPSIYHEQPIGYDPSQTAAGAAGDERAAYAKTQGLDRLSLVKNALARFDAESAPQLAALERGAGQKAAALGSLGSGRLNTSIGDYTANVANARQNLEGQQIDEATKGSIDDAFRQLGAAQQQQVIGTSQADAQYGRSVDAQTRATGLRRQGLLDRLQLGQATDASHNAALTRALGLGAFGYGNDPSNALFHAAGSAGQQGQQAGEAGGMGWSALAQALASFGGGRGASPGGVVPTSQRYAAGNPDQLWQ